MSPEAQSRKTRYDTERQRQRARDGICRCCDETVAPTSKFYCPYHLVTHRANVRDPHRNAYRLKHGIPLDAPLSRRGRPRL